MNADVASLMGFLRWWRFVNIVEEISGIHGDRIEAFEERVRKIKDENSNMVKELERRRKGNGAREDGEVEGEELEAQRDSGGRSEDT